MVGTELRAVRPGLSRKVSEIKNKKGVRTGLTSRGARVNPWGRLCPVTLLLPAVGPVPAYDPCGSRSYLSNDCARLLWNVIAMKMGAVCAYSIRAGGLFGAHSRWCALEVCGAPMWDDRCVQGRCAFWTWPNSWPSVRSAVHTVSSFNPYRDAISVASVSSSRASGSHLLGYRAR